MHQPYFPEDVRRRYQELRTAYGERDSDIYVSSYTRSGTTWMQMILYQLTTDGAMNFDHLFEVSPWLYYSALLGTEPACPPEPRILKTHDDYDFFSPTTKGCFIYVVRDGKDVAVSFYHHKVNAKGYQGTFEEHFDAFLNNTDYNWFQHVKAWIENAKRLPILYVKYEALKNDFDRTIQGIVDFCHLPVDEAILQRTKECTSFAFMKRYAAQLGPKPEHFRSADAAQYRVINQAEFIRHGHIGEGNLELTAQQKKMYYHKFNDVLGHLELLADYRDESRSIKE